MPPTIAGPAAFFLVLFTALTHTSTGQTIRLDRAPLRVSFPTNEGATYTVSGIRNLPEGLATFSGDGLPRRLVLDPDEGIRELVIMENGRRLTPNIRSRGATLTVVDTDHNAYALQSSSNLRDWSDRATILGPDQSLPLRFSNRAGYLRLARRDPADEPRGSGQIRGALYQLAGSETITFEDPFLTNQSGIPVSGAVVTLGPTGRTTRTDEAGAFLFENLLPGWYQLKATGTGQTVETRIFATGGIPALAGTYGLKREEVIPTVKGIAAENLAEPGQAAIFGLAQPLPRKAVVFLEPANGTGFRDRHQVRNSDWMFMIDPHPTNAFGHPVTYVFVDAFSGAVTTYSAFSSPSIEGLSFWRGEPPRPEEVIQIPANDESQPFRIPGVEIPENQPDGGEGQVRIARNLDAGATYLITLSAGTEPAFQASGDLVYEAMQPLYDEAIDAVDTPNWKTAASETIDRFNQTMDDEDLLVLYIAGHSSGSRDKESGALSLREEVVWATGTPSIRSRDLVNLIAKAKACQIIVIIESCYAGALVYPSPLGGTHDPFSVAAPDRIRLGQELLVISSTDTLHAAEIRFGRFRFSGLLTQLGGLFTIQAIHGGLIQENMTIQGTINAFRKLVVEDGQPASKQGSVFFYKGKRGACDEWPSDEVDHEPNDTVQTAQTVTIPTGEQEVLIGGTTSEDNPDVFRIEGIESTVLLELESSADLVELDHSLGSEPVAKPNEHSAIFEAREGQPIHVALRGSPHSRPNEDRYFLRARIFNPAAGVVFLNNSQTTYAFRAVLANEEINGGAFIILKPGQSYRQYYDSGPLTGYNVLDVHDVDDPNPIAGDNGFRFTIEKNHEQVFTFENQGNTFFQSPLFEH
ncbi:MAG: carboxypeptidase-like regulatory domain-containing protein [Verrucomicrobiota bacterium]